MSSSYDVSKRTINIFLTTKLTYIGGQLCFQFGEKCKHCVKDMEMVVGTSASKYGYIFFILSWLNLPKICDESKAEKFAMKYIHLARIFHETCLDRFFFSHKTTLAFSQNMTSIQGA